MSRHALRSIVLCLCTALFAASSFADELKRRGMMGIHPVPASEPGQPPKKGVRLARIFPDTAASKAGLEADDVVVKVNNREVADMQAFLTYMRQFYGGDTVTFTVERGKETLSKELTLMPRPKETSDKYELIYDSCKVKDWNVRTYVTKPKGEGKHPAVLFLFSPTPQPMEFPPQFGDHPYKKVIEALDAAGIATLRVDRVGVGDSEGGDPIQTTYETDVETYRSALKCLAKYDFVDPERVFIFGQGLGSALVPLVGQQPGIRGIVTYGSTVVRPFSEGMVDLFRRIWDLETVEAPEIEKRAKALAEFLAKAGKPDSNPGELLNDYPALGPIRESLVPQNGRSLLGMPIPYFQAIAANDLAAEWSRVSAPVLSLWGTSDYQAGRRDAELIAASAGSKVKGRGEFKMVDSVDHAMNLAEDQEDSYLSGYEGGEYSDAVAKELIAFIEKHDRKAA